MKADDVVVEVDGIDYTLPIADVEEAHLVANI